ncbi:MAG: cyclic pyranopterin monophosphate synthase MoaC [Bacteroidales bacterium]|nr:cyclic pyranopterin monophosphate synthase MoaC [Bacteroidales bacterium]MBN2818909.1 cyclic pyranopterin monophosphate synthase MoaC [Bacteroidales bacterium]
MVDVGDKPIQERSAIAEGKIILKPETIQLVNQNLVKKGDVLTVAQIAGIQAAKKTSELIPLCHPLMLNFIEVKLETHTDGITATATVKCNDKTGVEMEALTAVNVALLTVYDMCKAVDKEMQIVNVRLLGKEKK